MRIPGFRLTIATGLGALMFAACGDSGSDPSDCGWAIGMHFIALLEEEAYQDPGFSLAVGGTMTIHSQVHRTTEVASSFNPQQGWNCRTVASVSVPALITMSTLTPELAEVTSATTVRALAAGYAVLLLTSEEFETSREVWIQVK